ncbi:alpha-amylase family glycosyl hydrolase [Collinsella sp. An307]|uniref:alpha-amylase family glycosyl hydrolase n=1 Tax=Collinsella sp. An307 TaxID=1965630 RepID=UPI000B3A0F91|nr:alpha-amylase family glycosyl hydrolase [Collinsella sp. An307]OUO21751.1 maltodextrin glucosidase [Collinsella sp. An307]
MWAFESVFYQIFPLGFCGAPHENDGVVVPRIRRVAEWADYLEELGVGAVLLNPVFESSVHGYDTRDLTRVDCRLGTNEDLSEVVRELHARGIRVVLDAVFNHVGRDFWAFRDVRERRWDSPYKDWFCLNFDGDSAFGDGFWYEGWEGVYDLVKLNLKNPAVVDYLLDVVRAWRREFAIDGLRLDVAYSLDHDFLRRLHGVARELSGEMPAAAPVAGEHAGDVTFVLIGETLHGDYSQLVNADMLDSCTNYECYKGLYSSFNSQNMFEIAHSLHRQFGGDPWCIYRGLHLLSFADNHDVTRLASILSDPACIRPAYGLLFGMPGIPCLYYGSEWGATGTKGGGDDWALRPAFEHPEPNDLTGYIEQLVQARTAGAGARALCYGAYRNVQIQNKQLLFERAVEASAEGPAERVLVAVNAVAEPFDFSAGELAGAFCDLLTGEDVELAGTLHLEPYEVRYLLQR